jgi:glycosyltransferase involved in cell wall biosynthesis
MKEGFDLISGSPKITVLMPVYNGEQYLREAIESILNQSYTDFDFLIIDDGSTDQSANIINSYPDPRIRLVENERNMGLIHTLNRGIDLANSKFIARMDCDDISMPNRLSKQLALMEQHPAVGVCGGWIEYFMGKQLILKFPVNDKDIKHALLSYNPMAHPAIMIRAEVIKKNHIYYDPEYQHVEDYELWARLSSITCFANIPEVILKYRIHPIQIGRIYSAEQVKGLEKIHDKLHANMAFAI